MASSDLTDEARRVFTPQRAAQGFRDQGHLDAFYRHFDHVRSCTDCRPSSAWVDDSLQSTLVECPAGVRLYAASL